MSSVSLLDYPHREKELAGYICIEIGFRTGDERKSSHLDHSATIHFSMTWIGNTQKHEVIAQSIAHMSFRILGVPDFHFYAIADGTSDILKRGRRWRGFDPKETEKKMTIPHCLTSSG